VPAWAPVVLTALSLNVLDGFDITAIARRGYRLSPGRVRRWRLWSQQTLRQSRRSRATVQHLPSGLPCTGNQTRSI